MLLNTKAVAQKIQQLAGVDPLADYDESFFQPSGCDHFAQIYLNTLPEELAELEQVDQLYFLVSELSANLGVDLSLEADLPFATYRQVSSQGVAQIQGVFDFSDPLLTFVHLFGQAKALSQWASKIGATGLLQAAKLDRDSMLDARHLLGELQEVQISYEQSAKVFNTPEGLTANFKGPHCAKLLESLLESHPEHVCVEYLEGSGVGMPDSKIKFAKDGSMSANGIKLHFFLELAKSVGAQLGLRYNRFVDQHLFRLDSDKTWSQISGSPVIFQFQNPLNQVERLAKALCQGQKQLDCFGHHERLSPNLWEVSLFDTEGRSLRLELSAKQCAVYLSDRLSVVLLDRLETFLESQVSAVLGKPEEVL